MNKINFSKNYNNKLDCKYFTSIRACPAERMGYYNTLAGQDIEVILGGTTHSVSKVISVRRIRFENIDPTILTLDTGLQTFTENCKLFEGFGIKQDDMVVIILLKRLYFANSGHSVF